MRKIYDIVFYCLFTGCIPKNREPETNKYYFIGVILTYFAMCFFTLINAVSLVVLFDIMGFKEISRLLALPSIGLVLISNFVMVFPRRHYLNVTEKYKNMSKDIEKKCNVIAFRYILTTFLMIIVVAIVANIV